MSPYGANSVAYAEPWQLRLYVAGQSPKSLDAYSNLKAICEEHLPGHYEIEIVDLLEDPTMAATDNVLAVPTLVRCLPPPSRRIIGSLSNTERVMAHLRMPRIAGR